MNLKKYVSVPSFSAFFLTVTPLITSSLAADWLRQNEQMVQLFTRNDWLLMTLLCVFAVALALIPPTLLALGSGYFLGWAAVFPLVLLNMAAIGLVYGVIQWADTHRWRTYFQNNKRTAPFFERIYQNEFLFIFFTKLSPVLPFALTNLLFAVSGIRFRNVLLGGFCGMIPRTFLAVWVGKEAREIRQLLDNPNESIGSRVVIVVLVAFSVWGLFRVLSKRS